MATPASYLSSFPLFPSHSFPISYFIYSQSFSFSRSFPFLLFLLLFSLFFSFLCSFPISVNIITFILYCPDSNYWSYCYIFVFVSQQALNIKIIFNSKKNYPVRQVFLLLILEVNKWRLLEFISLCFLQSHLFVHMISLLRSLLWLFNDHKIQASYFAAECLLFS